jgi:hypothetical protein
MTSEPRPNQAPLITSRFCIAGRHFDTERCTAAIGITPTTIWRQQNTKIATDHPELPTTNWIIEVKDQRLYSTDDALIELFAIVWPSRERIQAFLHSSGLHASFGSIVTIHHERPLYELQPETLRKLAWFGCEYGMDIYDYSE